MYIRKFHERALDYFDPVDEDGLVKVYLHGTMEEYRIFFESFPSFPCYWKRFITPTSQWVGPRGPVHPLDPDTPPWSDTPTSAKIKVDSRDP